MKDHSKVHRVGINTGRGEKIYSSLHDQIQAYIARATPDENGCLIYPTKFRYPSMTHQKQSRDFGTWVLVSRGITDRNIVARHTCDNSRCVNPEHIVAGTQHDNIRDMIKRGRGNHILLGKGRKKKLTSEQVIEMRHLYTTGMYSQKALAHLFHVSSGSVHWYLKKYTLDSEAS